MYVICGTLSYVLRIRLSCVQCICPPKKGPFSRTAAIGDEVLRRVQAVPFATMNSLESTSSVPTVSSSVATVATMTDTAGSVKRREPSVNVATDENTGVISSDSEGCGLKRRCLGLLSRRPSPVLEPEEEQPGWLSIPDDVMTQIMLAATLDPKELFGFETSCRGLHETVDRCWRILSRDTYPHLRTTYGGDHNDNDNSNDNSTGKEMWIEGRALESLSMDRCQYTFFRNADPDIFRQGIFFGSNTSIMVMSSSDHDIPPTILHRQLDDFLPLPQPPLHLHNFLPDLPQPQLLIRQAHLNRGADMRWLQQEVLHLLRDVVPQHQEPLLPPDPADLVVHEVGRRLDEQDDMFGLGRERRRPRPRRRRRVRQWGRDGFLPPNPIRIRDASTLQILANMEGSQGHKAVDVFGPAGNEVIVEYLDNGLKAYRNCKLVWEYHWHSGSTFTIGGEHWPPPRLFLIPTDQWCLLPSETALLVVRDQLLHLFLIDASSNFIPYMATTVALGPVDSPTLNWVKEGFTFVLHVRPGEVTFWKIDHERRSVTNVRTMRLSVTKGFSFVYTGAKHFVAAGAPDDDAIYVFDCKGNLQHRLVEDIAKPRADYRWSPMNACLVQGCLLVSNSLMGAALCVWNLRTGQLVCRFEQSMNQGHSFRPGENFTDGTWVHCLDQLPSFDFPFFLMADNDGSLFSWGFPASDSQRRRIVALVSLAAQENR